MRKQEQNLLLQLGMPVPGVEASEIHITTLPQPIARPPMSGEVAELEKMFNGIKVKMDDEFKEFIAPLNGRYYDIGRVYDVFQTDETSQSDTAIIHKFSLTKFLTPAEACGTIAWLATDAGKPHLALPETPIDGEYETNFILGYIKKGEVGSEKLYVVFIERECEDGKEEIHIHVRRADRWRSDCPKGVYELEGMNAV